MKYQIDSGELLVELDRTAIVDISVGDVIEVPHLKAEHEWREQDMQFVESNPDARIFVRFAAGSNGVYQGQGLVVVPEEVA